MLHLTHAMMDVRAEASSSGMVSRFSSSTRWSSVHYVWNLIFGQGMRGVALATLQCIPRELLSVENRGYDPMRLSWVVLLRHVQAMFFEDALAIDGIVSNQTLP